MEADKEDAFNVMILASVISLLVIVGSIIALDNLTGDLYLNSYFTLETFFDGQNTAASTQLATLAFSNPSIFLPIVTIVVIDGLSRILIVSFIIAAVIDFLNYANVERIINGVKSGALRNHVILCGYNEITDRLVARLKEQRTPYIVVEHRKAKETELNEKHIFNIAGEFTSEETLIDAKISRAYAIVFDSDKDVDNVVGSIIARRLNPKIKVLIRVSDDSVRKKAYGIGTDMAVIPEHLAGIEIGDYISRIYGVQAW